MLSLPFRFGILLIEHTHTHTHDLHTLSNLFLKLLFGRFWYDDIRIRCSMHHVHDCGRVPLHSAHTAEINDTRLARVSVFAFFCENATNENSNANLAHWRMWIIVIYKNYWLSKVWYWRSTKCVTNVRWFITFAFAIDATKEAIETSRTTTTKIAIMLFDKMLPTYCQHKEHHSMN